MSEAGFSRIFIPAVLFVYIGGISLDLSNQMLLAAAVGCVACSVLLYRLWCGAVHWLETGIVLGAMFFMQFANGAVYAYYYPEGLVLAADIEQNLSYDLVLILIGLLAWVGGYALPAGRFLGHTGPELTRTFGYQQFTRTWLAGMAFCWGLRLSSMVSLASPALVSSYRNLPQLLLPIGVTVWMALEREGHKRSSFLLSLVGAFVLEIAYQLPSTMKGNLFHPFLFSLLGFYLVRKRMPVKTLGVLFLVACVWIPVGLKFRNYRFAQPWMPTLEAIGYSVEDVLWKDSGEVVSELWFYLLRRNQMLDVFDVVVANVPEVEPYRYGSTYTDIPLMLIPRLLWPEKPVFNYMKGEWGRDMAGITPETEAVGMGLVAEFYFNFGPAGIVVGMLLFGVFCRALWVWFHERNQANLPAALFYLIVVKQLLSIGAVATVAVGLVQYVVLYYVFYRLTTQAAESTEAGQMLAPVFEPGR